MRKTSCILLAAIFILFNAHAQSSKAIETPTSSAKVIYAEIGGPGVASLNYDMRFGKREDGLGFRAGFGGFSIEETSLVFLPVGLNYIVSKDQKNYFEVGVGITPIITSEADSGDPLTTTFGHLNIGYRLQPVAGGFFFKAAINPIFGRGFFWPYYAGIGFGYKF